MTKEIGIIGAGWYGCHVALALTKKGYKVTVFEKNLDIFQGVSGDFGIRLHKGPHYPRSLKTRESCRRAFDEFLETYPDLIVKHEYSTYALGTIDSMKNPPKVNKDEFKDVCFEDTTCEELSTEKYGYDNLHNVMNLEEPSIVVGNRLREAFRGYLRDAGVTLKCNFLVTELKAEDDTAVIVGGKEKYSFIKVVNATGCAAYLPTNISTVSPVSMEVIYQPCLGLVYADKQSGPKPFSFIVMDGWFPCVMPYLDESVPGVDASFQEIQQQQQYGEEEEEEYYEVTDLQDNCFVADKVEDTESHSIPNEQPLVPSIDGVDAAAVSTIGHRRKYVLTHGNYTIMASCASYKEASGILEQLDDTFIAERIQPPSEREINRFWPEFKDRFEYLGWKGRVLAKLRTKTEFRSAVTFAHPAPIIHIIPGLTFFLNVFQLLLKLTSIYLYLFVLVYRQG